VNPFRAINDKLDRLLAIVIPLGARLMNNDQVIADLTAAIAQATTVQAGGLTLVQGLANQLKSLAAAATAAAQGIDPAVVEALAAKLVVQSNAFAAALVANTPAATTPTVPPPPPPAPTGAATPAASA
jgi:hypothetical protein